ncbi:MAG: exodeoxyribonuclease large subunit [Blastocatellia bacterium]|jgi:exodeoxyribonuclease VII large subunit|nr:exodeoxyribonuclease large subunit [Blastocatellia bacterium]
MSQPFLSALFDTTERQPLSVSELTGMIRGELERRFSSVWVEGEISNFRAHGSGHWYFTLKDESAQMRCACYRSSNQRIRFRPEDGLQMRARGRLSVYEQKGEYQLIVDALEPVGAGALQLAFEQTKARLQAEGLFAESLKRAIPMLPRRVGVITSPTGAAIRDILHVIARRTRTVHVLFAATRVQGDGAAQEIVRAIKSLNDFHARAGADEGIDVIIVGRGGGSIEDLWAFNEEVVARAIRASAIPVISAVGHETDFTIADFVADMRAPTPSAAAEIVAAHEAQLCSLLASLTRNLGRSIRYRIAGSRAEVQELALSPVFDAVSTRLHEAIAATGDAEHRLQTAITSLFQSAQRRVGAATHSLSPAQLRSAVLTARTRLASINKARDAAVATRLETARQQLAMAAAALDAMSPLRVLERGYAIVHDSEGHIVREANAVTTDDALRLRLWKGVVNCRVEGTEEN